MGVPIPKCFTCGKVLGHLWRKYLEATAGNRNPQEHKIYAEVVYDENENVLLDGLPETPAHRFFEEHKIRRICCRRMLLCQPEHFPHVLEHQIPVNSRISVPK